MYVFGRFETQLRTDVTTAMLEQALLPMRSSLPLLSPESMRSHAESGFAVRDGDDLEVEFDGPSVNNFREKFVAVAEAIGQFSEYAFAVTMRDGGDDTIETTVVCGPDAISIKRMELELALLELQDGIKHANSMLKGVEVTEAGLLSASTLAEFNENLAALQANLLIYMRPDEIFNGRQQQPTHERQR